MSGQKSRARQWQSGSISGQEKESEERRLASLLLSLTGPCSTGRGYAVPVSENGRSVSSVYLSFLASAFGVC